MAILMRGVVILGLLLGGVLSGVDDVVKQLTAQVQTMEQLQAKLCDEAGLCYTDPLAKMIQTMTETRTRLQEMVGVDNEPQGPQGPDEANGPEEANGPYQCALTCEGAEEGCVPCEPNGPNGAGAANSAGQAAGPVQCAQTCEGADEGCVPCEGTGPIGPNKPSNDPDR